MVPELVLVAQRITLHTASKVRHGGEQGIICWSPNYGTKQSKQEPVRHEVEEAVHAELDRKRC
jgi:hypothetical protein